MSLDIADIATILVSACLGLPFGILGLGFFLYPRKAIESAMVRGNPKDKFNPTAIFTFRFLLGGFFMFAGFGIPILLFFRILISKLN